MIHLLQQVLLAYASTMSEELVEPALQSLAALQKSSR